MMVSFNETSSMETCYGNVVPELQLYFETKKECPKNGIYIGEQKYPLTGECPRIRLRNFFINKSHSDVSITLKKTQERYEIHKLILKMTSFVFEEMLADGKEELSIDEDPDAFRWILLHAYFGYSEIPQKISDVVSLYKTLRKYAINTVADKMAVHLSGNINVETVDEIFDVAIKYKEALLENGCHKIIESNAEQLLDMAAKGSISPLLLMTLLKNDTLCIEEIKLFEAVVSWGKLNVLDLDEKGDIKLRDFLRQFLFEIDFLSMQPEELIKIVAKEDIFTDEEIIGILMTSRGIVEEFSEPKNDNDDDKKALSSFESKVQKCYPSFLRTKPKQRRFNSPDSFIRTCSIVSYMKCDYKSKWLPSGVYVLMNLQVTEDIYLRQIKARGDCFLGETYLDIKDCELGGINSSMPGPPWIFNFPVNIKRKVSYIVIVKGKGRICKHEFVMFSTEHLGLEFCGETVMCDISLNYLK